MACAFEFQRTNPGVGCAMVRNPSSMSVCKPHLRKIIVIFLTAVVERWVPLNAIYSDLNIFEKIQWDVFLTGTSNPEAKAENVEGRTWVQNGVDVQS